MQEWVIWVIWISILIVPFLMCVFGLILMFKIPKQNKIFGYRTKKTLSCEKTWALANILWGQLALLCGTISLIILSIILYLTIPDRHLIGLIVSGIVIIFTIVIPIIVVEIKIKKSDFAVQ